ncbi:hypothetical protein SARC_10997 [Sphaeroforma arctica JP610]|uniref:RecF/RecN/SMC N-terminal domain-containing protein n=1 Tax=Sphaeroforma arctica JP610 TaxID=667725 RepID=A0A0L0FJ61_9EUKA|nr:hypothetical protein SARC_10997 [Sphaeroforma arctica JP610]KNC76506.1 hypothetical protein SARC_10997 [Sphaeroforma arctica JP610]|eukprot:XP_014150408.1 hypothetical protein SARC_10997 [Sphaeroforma arctica JP610]
MGNEGYKGKVRIDNENKLLSITAEPRAKENPNGRRTTKTLSGGERSFSLVCFLIAIWNAMDCPFRALDEFDVYMDMYNRKLSLRLLTKLAIGLKNRQFLFISPQNMDGLVEGPNVRIHRMIDPERDQQRLPFVPAHYVRE